MVYQFVSEFCHNERRQLAIFLFGVGFLKWYYDENRIFPIEAIFKHKQVVCMRRKSLLFQISLFVPEIFKFLKYAN